MCLIDIDLSFQLIIEVSLNQNIQTRSTLFRICNIQHSTANIQNPKSNIQHPTTKKGARLKAPHIIKID